VSGLEAPREERNSRPDTRIGTMMTGLSQTNKPRTPVRFTNARARSEGGNGPNESSPRIRVLASDPVDLEQVERQLRERLDFLGPAPRAELLHVLMLPDLERVLPSRRPPRGERVTDRPNAANCAWFSADDLGRKVNVLSRCIRRSFRHTRRGAKEGRARDHH